MVEIIWAALGVGIVVGLVAFSVTVYNNLVTFKRHADAGFAQIEIQLKRRYDLVPNVVECVDAYMSHERETLAQVIEARNRAVDGLDKLAHGPLTTHALGDWMSAESILVGALARLSAIIEDYPDLKANERFAQLFEELTSTENRIAFARQAYNDWVTEFNTYRQCFPNVCVARLVGYGDDLDLIEFQNAEEIQNPPRVMIA